MSIVSVQPGEIRRDEALVRRLLAAQFPQWQHLPINPPSRRGGTIACFGWALWKAIEHRGAA
jgi:hypothetical protein